MDLRHDNMDNLLATLGEAHESGAFSDRAARYPWRESAPAQSRGRRHAWVWVAGPLAAAAAVAVVFVGPNLFSGRMGSQVALNHPANILSVQPELHADAGATPKASPSECDINGDGRVDGLDIPALMELRPTAAEDPAANRIWMQKAEKLSQCMLAGNS